MDLVRDYIFALIAGTRRYHFGGAHPLEGFDCSGLALEILQAFGVLPHGIDMTAQGLYNHFEKTGGSGWGIGSLAFYGKDALHVTHVAICLDSKFMVEAGGGSSDTVTDEIAIKKKAFVRIRPIKYRKDFLCVLKPTYIV